MEPLSNAARKSLASLLQYPLGPAGRAYLEARGLGDVAGSLSLGEVSASPRAEHRRYAGRLVIPSFSARGTVCDMALRCMVHEDCGSVVLWTDKDGKDRTCRKYEFLTGVSKRLYGLEDLAAGGPSIHIAEGHPDRMTLKACGLPAVGVAGVNAWKNYHSRLFAGFEQVYFWAQSDDKGQSEGLGERIRSSVSRVSVMMVADGEDLNSFYVKHGRQAVLDLLDDGEAEASEGEADDDDPRWANSGYAPPPF